MTRHRIAVAYFIVQALAVAGWWGLLALQPDLRPLFELHAVPQALSAFLPGDLGVIALGSALVAIRRGRGWSLELAWLVVGAMVYGAVYTVTATLLGEAGPLGALLMVPAAGASFAAALTLSREARDVALPAGPTA